MKKILFVILLVFSLMNIAGAESFSESLLTKDQPTVAILGNLRFGKLFRNTKKRLNSGILAA